MLTKFAKEVRSTWLDMQSRGVVTIYFEPLGSCTLWFGMHSRLRDGKSVFETNIHIHLHYASRVGGTYWVSELLQGIYYHSMYIYVGYLLSPLFTASNPVPSDPPVDRPHYAMHCRVSGKWEVHSQSASAHEHMHTVHAQSWYCMSPGCRVGSLRSEVLKHSRLCAPALRFVSFTARPGPRCDLR